MNVNFRPTHTVSFKGANELTQVIKSQNAHFVSESLDDTVEFLDSDKAKNMTKDELVAELKARLQSYAKLMSIFK